MNVKKLLPDETTKILTEESLNAIESAFNDKVKITVDVALTEQDDLYAAKLEQLITAIDKDHTSKLNRVIEAVDRNNARKLKAVIKKYDSSLTTEAKTFKTNLIDSISSYLEEFVEESIPTEAINEATKNRTAREVLKNLRKVLAVDSALMSESVQDAVVDGKQQIDTLTKQVADLRKENTVVKEGYRKVKASLLLETKSANLSEKKREYINRVLGDKSPAFIEENFDYTLRLFEKKEKEHIDIIKEEAFSNRRVKADAPIIQESVQRAPKKQDNPYLNELKRYK